MAEVQIEIGMSSTHAHLGIQPPLTPWQTGLLYEAHSRDTTIPAEFAKKELLQGDPYSEYSLAVNSTLNSVEAEQKIFDVAEKIVDVFREHGIDVGFDDYTQPVSNDYFLFGCKKAA